MAKIRRAKRRLDEAAELAAWRDVLGSGHDFFGDLEPFGIVGDEAARAAAPEAWSRLGAAFLASWEPLEGQEQPWALEAFGKPWEGRHAR